MAIIQLLIRFRQVNDVSGPDPVSPDSQIRRFPGRIVVDHLVEVIPCGITPVTIDAFDQSTDTGKGTLRRVRLLVTPLFVGRDFAFVEVAAVVHEAVAVGARSAVQCCIVPTDRAQVEAVRPGVVGVCVRDCTLLVPIVVDHGRGIGDRRGVLEDGEL